MTEYEQWHCHYCFHINKKSGICQICHKSIDYVHHNISFPFHGDDYFIFRPNQLSKLFQNESILKTCDKGWSALHHACLKCNYDICDELIKLGSDIHSKTVEGFTPLHLAVHSGHIDVVQLLLSKGVDINVQTFLELTTPIHFAIKLNMKNIVDTLLQYKVNIHLKNVIGRTPLHFAAQYGTTDITLALIKNEADINNVDYHGWTPKLIAEFYDNYEVLELLKQYEIDNTTGKTQNAKSLMSLWVSDPHTSDWDYVKSNYHSQLR
jgi:ankyrin repeat protein